MYWHITVISKLFKLKAAIILVHRLHPHAYYLAVKIALRGFQGKKDLRWVQHQKMKPLEEAFHFSFYNLLVLGIDSGDPSISNRFQKCLISHLLSSH